MMTTDVPESNRFDLTIIGGGPTALFGAFYAGLRQMSVKIIDSLPALGGQLSALYPEKFVYDMPGFPAVLARDLAAALTEQAMSADPTVCLEEQVLALDRVTPDWIALTTNRGVNISRTALIAAGVGSFTPRSIKVPGVDVFLDRGVHYFVRNKEELRGKRVLVVGGGDSACDWALNLLGIAKQVTLIHRRDVFRAHEETVHRLMGSPADVKLFRTLKEVHGTDSVEGATVEDARDKSTERLDADAILLTIGFTASLGPILDWNLNLERNKIRVDSTMATNLPGVFAAGDICTYPGKLDLIATGVGEAATAVNHAKNFLDPAAKIAPGHSSDLDTSITNVRVETDTPSEEANR